MNVGEVIDLAHTTKNFIYGLGLAIQYGIVIIIWLISVLLNIKSLKIAKIVLYCSIDMIIPLVLPIFCLFCFSPHSSRLAHYVQWMFVFALLVICSKVAFFKFYKNRFALQDC